MDQELIHALRAAARESKALDAFLHVCTLRQRSRSRLPLASLVKRMRQEGFDLDQEEYEGILRLLGKHGVGTLQTDAKGRVCALNNVRLSLKSLALAVLAQSKTLVAQGELLKTSTATKTQYGAGATAGFPVSITVVVNGKPVNFRIPKELDEHEIADLVVRFRDKGAERTS